METYNYSSFAHISIDLEYKALYVCLGVVQKSTCDRLAVLGRYGGRGSHQNPLSDQLVELIEF